MCLTLVHATTCRVNIADALTGVTKSTPCLGGFLALTDSIVSLILNSPSTSDNMTKVYSESLHVACMPSYCINYTHKSYNIIIGKYAGKEYPEEVR